MRVIPTSRIFAKVTWNKSVQRAQREAGDHDVVRAVTTAVMLMVVLTTTWAQGWRWSYGSGCRPGSFPLCTPNIALGPSQSLQASSASTSSNLLQHINSAQNSFQKQVHFEELTSAWWCILIFRGNNRTLNLIIIFGSSDIFLIKSIHIHNTVERKPGT